MNIKILVACVVAVAVMLVGAYHKGYSTADVEWKAKQEQATNEQLMTVRDIEQASLAKQAEIARDYEEQINELKTKYVAGITSITSSNLSNVSVHNAECNAKSSNLPTTKADTRKLACYTEDQLLGKIKESMAIVSECQLELVRCSKLIEAVRSE